MDRLSKIKLAIEKGYTCNPEKGEVYGQNNKLLTAKMSSGYKVFVFEYDGKKIHIKQHIFIYYCFHNKLVNCIDHINMDKSDNRIENLREVTKQQNSFNTKAKGYSKVKTGYSSYIRFNGKKIHLGNFKNEIEAKEAYQEAKKLYHVI